MTLLPWFEWCEATALGQGVRASLWLFPVIESVHLIGLAVLGGAVLLVDLRLLGLGLKSQPAGQLAKDAQPWLVASLVLMLATGVSLFLSEAVKCYWSPAFWVKMTTLPFAILFTLALRRRVLNEARPLAPLAAKALALLSLSLWFTVAAAGRWIGFSG